MGLLLGSCGEAKCRSAYVQTAHRGVEVNGSNRQLGPLTGALLMQSLKLAPPNSLVLVMDSGARDLPKSMDGSLVSATPSAVAIGCRAEVDGETEVRLGRDEEVDMGSSPVFVGQLETPTGIVSVRSVLDEEVLSLRVGRERVTLRVWADDPVEPSVVSIGVS